MSAELSSGAWHKAYFDEAKSTNKSYPTLVDLEADPGIRITNVCDGLVPGLLQTPAYMDSALRRSGPKQLTEEEVGVRAAIRTERQTPRTV